MLLRFCYPQRAFALLWVMLAMGAMGVLAMGLSVWVGIESQRGHMRMAEAQARFASQAVLRQVMGDLQWMLGPDTRVVEPIGRGQYRVWNSGAWDPVRPMDRDGLEVGVLGMQEQDGAAMKEFELEGGKCVCCYRYSLTPGWAPQDVPTGVAKPKRILADVRQGGLCQALDAQDDWLRSDILIWDIARWPHVNFIGPTRGQVQSFLKPSEQGIILAQSSVQNAQSNVLPRIIGNSKYFANASIHRPIQMARYLRPVKVELDCFLRADNVQVLNANNVHLDLHIVAVAEVMAMNPYDNELGGGVYFLELDKHGSVEHVFDVVIQTMNAKGAFNESFAVQRPWAWAMNANDTQAFAPSNVLGDPRAIFITKRIGSLSLASSLNFINIKQDATILVNNCRWKLGANIKEACELELMQDVSLKWDPHEKDLRGLTVGALIQQGQVFLGTFSTEYAAAESLTMVGRRVWAPSNFYSPRDGQESIRWAMGDALLNQTLQIPSFSRVLPESVIDVIHWGEWSPYQWAQGMPFNAIRPRGCKATEYTWNAGDSSRVQLLDIAWLMGETLLDKYYLSTQAGIDADSPGWADYGLNVNDKDPEHWADHLQSFLNPEDAKRLGQACVDVLKERGPFMGVADFVNRRLVDSAQGEQGAFEEACERLEIPQDESLDFITKLLPYLSAREDAWTIDVEVEIQHAQSRKLQGRKKLRAWVQRGINYVDGGAQPARPFSWVNDSLGRKWAIVAMQWL